MNKDRKILVVEDEELILRGLTDALKSEGYEVDAARDGQDGLERALRGNYDLLLLDLMLPRLDGLTVCNRIRERDRSLAVIILTAKASDDDIVKGFTLGADDYVTKPFSMQQLLLRIEAVLRRTAPAGNLEKKLLIGDHLAVDLEDLIGLPLSQKITGAQAAGKIFFTRREVELLRYLYRHTDQAVGRDELLTRVWNYRPDSNLDTRTVDIHIAKLRQKIEPNPRRPKHLVTVRSEGYQLLFVKAEG